LIQEISRLEFEKMKILKTATHYGTEYITVPTGVVQIYNERIIYKEIEMDDIPKKFLLSNDHKIDYVNWNSDKMIHGKSKSIRT